MDSPIVTRIFRQLFAHETCSTSRASRLRSVSNISAPRQLVRTLYRSADKHVSQENQRRESSWQQRTDIFPRDKMEEFNRYPLVTADTLRVRKTRPKRVKMLMRDFIEDSLYNPNYGYFSRNVVIFSTRESFNFNSMKNEAEFNGELDRRYKIFEDELDEEDFNEARQLWHTPTELFRPYYGEAIARYLLTNYKLALFPYHDLLIYEMGAGNGTLMLNILDYLRNEDPDVYERTRFRIIEISSSLASLQAGQLQRNASARGHADRVEIINRSIFDWNQYISSPCFFLALEVFDNFAHDALRYHPVTEEPMQAYVLIDADSDFYEFYDRNIDPIAARFLRVRDAACSSSYAHPLRMPRFLRQLRAMLPLAPNLTMPEFIPTRLMQFFDVLHEFFPGHRLVTSDFHSLPDSIPGINAPVVQTRYQRRVVPVTTPLVHQGYFDILFPTDFMVMEDMYRAITGKLTTVLTQEEFLRRWAYVEDTQTKNGDNPLLSWYKNASVLVTI